ncbi:hypothetical protein ACYPKM_02545 [Pseudomonas aeruginosa]
MSPKQSTLLASAIKHLKEVGATDEAAFIESLGLAGKPAAYLVEGDDNFYPRVCLTMRDVQKLNRSSGRNSEVRHLFIVPRDARE